MLRPTPRKSFYVVVSWSGNGKDAWRWEIRRKRRPMGVRLWEGGFRSHRAAQLAAHDYVPGGEVINNRQRILSAMVGVNYKFHWDGPVVAKY
jgi:hypothetical protein